MKALLLMLLVGVAGVPVIAQQGLPFLGASLRSRPQVASSPAPTAWWKLNDASSSVTDASGNGHTGTWSSTVTTDTGLNGFNSVFTTAQSMTFTGIPVGSDTYTITGWVKPSNVGATYQGLVWDNTQVNYGFYLNANVLDLYQGSDNTSSGTLAAGSWYFVAASVNAGAVTFYVILSSAGSISGNSGTASGVTGTPTWAALFGAFGNGFTADVQDWRLFNGVALSMSQLNTQFTSGAQ